MPSVSQLFFPDRVAVVGATDRPGSIGRAIMENLLADFSGDLVAVNPSRSTVLGVDCHDSVGDVPDPIDLVIVVVPASVVREVIEEAADVGVKHFVVISAGFAEVGEEGAERERAISELAADRDLIVVGPNSLGIIDTDTGLNATFAEQNAMEGTISFMSQSGAFVTAVLDWAWDREIGFRQIVSLGNEAVVDEVDLLHTWADDDRTDVILGYVEDVKRGRPFIDAATAVTRSTPVVLLKSGRSAVGARAAASHTGAMAGSERAYETAFRQAGVIRADTVEELFDYGRVLAAQPPMTGDRIAIVSNAGGPGVLAADAVGETGLQLAEFEGATREELGTILPDEASVTNPLDIIGDAPIERFTTVLHEVVADSTVDGLVVIACPTAIFDHEDLAREIGAITQETEIPTVTCLMGGAAGVAASRVLDTFDVPNFFDPSRAIRSVAVLARYRDLGERDPDPPTEFPVDRDRARAVIADADAEGRRHLGPEAMGILDAYGIDTPAGDVVTSVVDAETVADRLDGPVVMKVVSPDIVHKSDIGGVRIGVDPGDVGDVYGELLAAVENHDPDAELLGIQLQEQLDMDRGVEVIAGMSRDEQFGPVVMFGLGGIFVEMIGDVAFRIAPFGHDAAREMTREIETASMLRGARGREAVNIDAIVDVLQRLSQLVTDHPEIAELDVNPLLTTPEAAIAVDFRMRIDREFDPPESGE